MKLNKLELFNSYLGEELVSALKEYNDAILNYNNYIIGLCRCNVKLLFLTIESIYGVKLIYYRTDDYYAVGTDEGTDYLIKIYY